MWRNNYSTSQFSSYFMYSSQLWQVVLGFVLRISSKAKKSVRRNGQLFSDNTTNTTQQIFSSCFSKVFY